MVRRLIASCQIRAVPLPADFEPLDISPTEYRRDTGKRYGDYKLAAKIIRNRLFLLTGREEKLKPRVAQLTVDSLFSSRKSDQLLYFKGDHEKREWPENISSKVRCGLERIRQRAEANGYTAFAVMLVPDKLSVYSPWLVDDSLAHLTLLDDEALTAIPHSLDISGHGNPGKSNRVLSISTCPVIRTGAARVTGRWHSGWLSCFRRILLYAPEELRIRDISVLYVSRLRLSMSDSV